MTFPPSTYSAHCQHSTNARHSGVSIREPWAARGKAGGPVHPDMQLTQQQDRDSIPPTGISAHCILQVGRKRHGEMRTMADRGGARPVLLQGQVSSQGLGGARKDNTPMKGRWRSSLRS